VGNRVYGKEEAVVSLDLLLLLDEIVEFFAFFESVSSSIAGTQPMFVSDVFFDLQRAGILCWFIQWLIANG
jgi:hypothetical protein